MTQPIMFGVIVSLIGCIFGYFFSPNLLLIITTLGLLFTWLLMTYGTKRSEGGLRWAMMLILFCLPNGVMWVTLFIKNKYLT